MTGRGGIGGSSRILRRDDLGQMRSAEKILRDAEESRQLSEEQAARMGDDIVSEARQRALHEAARTASRVIAEAEQAAETRLRNMEPELARLVAQTVRLILGEFQPEEATYLAARNALSQMREHRNSRIFASEEVVEPVRRAVEELGQDGPEIVAVIPDPALEPGRISLNSDRGSAEIGLDALISRALQTWEDAAAAQAEAEAAANQKDEEDGDE
ncbi:hypothetical protein [Paracoccus sp. (in: a-proteobacteria)]|uniref:hypothetical protein n=1 Tax=Paracoccus sp. TaxID=267 RepID=UPI003A869575